MSPRGTPGPGQESLPTPGLEEFSVPDTEAQRAIDMDTQIPFARAISLEFWGYSPHEFADVGVKSYELVARDSLFAALFPHEGRFVLDQTALPPEDYETLVRNPEAFAKSTDAKTMRARQVEPLDRRENAAKRSQIHAFESKLLAIGALHDRLELERDVISAIHERTSNFRLRRELGKNMLIRMALIQQFTFEKMLEIAAAQESWDEATLNRAKRAMTLRLLGTKQHSEKIHYWKQMVELARIHNFKRRVIAKQNTAKINRYMRKEFENEDY